jgi:hypothetical protein
VVFATGVPQRCCGEKGRRKTWNTSYFAYVLMDLESTEQPKSDAKRFGG